MKKIAFLFAFAVGFAQAAGETARPPHRAVKVGSKVIDLDLTLDFDEDQDGQSGQRASAAAPGSHGWIYWAMGATVAAGGLGWYLHDQDAKAPAVTRTEQVFTDDR
jgi:hypothetical protein